MDDFPRTVALAKHQTGQQLEWFISCLRRFVDAEVNSQLVESPDDFDADLALVMAAKTLLDTLSGGSAAVEAEQILSGITENGE